MIRPVVLVVASAIFAAGCASAPRVAELDSSVGSGSDFNLEEIEQAVVREYRASGMMEQGIEGTTHVWMYFNERGRVEDAIVGTSSGNEALDQAALRVARVIRTQPALNRGRPVPVWILQPISFPSGLRPPDDRLPRVATCRPETARLLTHSPTAPASLPEISRSRSHSW